MIKKINKEGIELYGRFFEFSGIYYLLHNDGDRDIFDTIIMATIDEMDFNKAKAISICSCSKDISKTQEYLAVWKYYKYKYMQNEDIYPYIEYRLDFKNRVVFIGIKEAKEINKRLLFDILTKENTFIFFDCTEQTNIQNVMDVAKEEHHVTHLDWFIALMDNNDDSTFCYLDFGDELFFGTFKGPLCEGEYIDMMPEYINY